MTLSRVPVPVKMAGKERKEMKIAPKFPIFEFNGEFFFDHRVFRDEMLRLLENREFLKANPAKTSSFVRVVEIFDRRRSEDADDMFAGNPDESDHETCHAASHLCRFPSRESPTPSRSGDWLGVHGPSLLSH